MPDPGHEPLIESAWRVVNAYAYTEDEADTDTDTLGEAITALHAALEAATDEDIEQWRQRPEPTHHPRHMLDHRPITDA